MASQEELTAALAESLEQRGLLQAVRSQLYGEVLSTLHGAEAPVPPPRPPPEALLINDLIREYLSYTGFGHTLAAFDIESGGAAAAPDDRDRAGGPLLPARILASELGISRPGGAPAADVPLLYHLVAAARAARQTKAELEGGAGPSGTGRGATAAHFAGSRVVDDVSRFARTAHGVGTLHTTGDTVTLARPLGLAQPLESTFASASSAAPHARPAAAAREPREPPLPPSSSASSSAGRGRSDSNASDSDAAGSLPGRGGHHPPMGGSAAASVSAAGLRAGAGGLFSAAAPSSGPLLMFAGE